MYSINDYRTEHGKDFVKELSNGNNLDEICQNIAGDTRKALYANIPSNLGRWHGKLQSPDYSFKFKWMTGIGIFTAIGVILPLAIVFGLSSDGFAISVAMGSYASALASLSVIAFFVTHFFHNRFMNGLLDEGDIAYVKEKILQDLKTIIQEEMREISSKYQETSDLCLLHATAKNQLESLYYLGKFTNAQISIDGEKFNAFKENRNLN